MHFFGLFGLLTVLLCYIKAEEITRENVLTIIEECKEEEGATEDDIATFKARMPPTTKEGKCMRACLMRHLGVLVDGDLDKDNAIKLAEVVIHEEDKIHLAATLVESCESLDFHDDPCEAAGQYVTCMYTYAQEHGIVD
ncbi:general odorant-binding protein 19d-like [Musca vetustissima]|uniref:general odorant-binding protein 19d-like n=1 Tax=Musca vetustissima TaxID=27455 RepID=UPI002AB6F012|nr:general odorant-binding protein 19d-like [Musca vetustissima]